MVALPSSSGTTGLAKGVMLTDKNLVGDVAQTLGAIPSAPDERLMAVLPFFHIYGMQCMMNCGLRAGATVVTLPRFDLEQFPQAHRDYRITRSFVAPPIVLALARHPPGGFVRPQPPAADELRRRTAQGGAGGRVQQAAGLRGGTGLRDDRAVPSVAPDPAGWFKPGSVGITAPSTQTRIVDPVTGTDLGTGEGGEV